MSNDVELIKRKEQRTLIIRESVGMLKLPKVMGPAYMKIFNYLKEKDFEPAAAPFTGYQVDNWDEAINMSGLKMLLSVFTKKWDIEMGFEVPDHIEGYDNMEIKSLPAGEYLQALHVGPYQKVGQVYKRMYKYAKDNNLKLGNKSLEFYLNDPGEVSKDKLETRVLVPVVK